MQKIHKRIALYAVPLLLMMLASMTTFAQEQADKAFRTGDYTNAENLYTNAANRAKRNGDSRLEAQMQDKAKKAKACQDLLTKANRAYSNGNYSDAKTYYERLQRQNSADPTAKKRLPLIKQKLEGQQPSGNASPSSNSNRTNQQSSTPKPSNKYSTDERLQHKRDLGDAQYFRTKQMYRKAIKKYEQVPADSPEWTQTLRNNYKYCLNQEAGNDRTNLLKAMREYNNGEYEIAVHMFDDVSRDIQMWDIKPNGSNETYREAYQKCQSYFEMQDRDNIRKAMNFYNNNQHSAAISLFQQVSSKSPAWTNESRTAYRTSLDKVNQAAEQAKQDSIARQQQNATAYSNTLSSSKHKYRTNPFDLNLRSGLEIGKLGNSATIDIPVEVQFLELDRKFNFSIGAHLGRRGTLSDNTYEDEDGNRQYCTWGMWQVSPYIGMRLLTGDQTDNTVFYFAAEGIMNLNMGFRLNTKTKEDATYKHWKDNDVAELISWAMRGEVGLATDGVDLYIFVQHDITGIISDATYSRLQATDPYKAFILNTTLGDSFMNRTAFGVGLRINFSN